MEKNTMRRKTYAKPCVEFVDFSLTGSIAATCARQGTYTDWQTCGYIDAESGWTVYLNGVCQIAGTDPDGQFCQHVPTADTSVFGS